MEEKELETRIDGEEYFVHSYGDEDFFAFWDTYDKVHNVPSTIDENVKYDFNAVLFDYISQLATFADSKNFVIGFSTVLDDISDPKELIYSVSYLIEEHFGVKSDVTDKHQVRIWGELDGYVEAPTRMQITIVGTKQVYDFIIDAKGKTSLVEFDNNFAVPSHEYLGDINVSGTINTPKAVIRNNQLLGERHRAVTLFNGTHYMREGQQINLALSGYNTGQIEKMVYKFSKYDPTEQEALNEAVSSYITYNNASSDGFDGFYATNSHLTATNGKAFIDEFITKSFNLNSDGVLTGYSDNNYTLTNKIVLRSVTAIIDEEYWNQIDEENNDELEAYPTIATTGVDPNADEIYLKDADTAYDIYNLDEEELTTFKTLCKK